MRFSNVRAILYMSLVSLAASTAAAGQIVSNFDSSDEGWTIFNTSNNAVTPVTYNATGGNPGGDVSYATTTTSALIYYFNAPSKFLGSHSSSYNQTLTLDLMQSATGGDNSAGDILFESPTFTILVYQLPAKPAAGSWSSYTIPLNETAPGWHVGTPTGVAPTKDQFKGVLANMASFRVRVKYLTGNPGTYTGALDNVVMNVPTVIAAPVITAVSPLLAFPGATITITGTNFNTTASKNQVFFGGVSTFAQTASATQLTVKLPAGAKFGRVTVLDAATGRLAQSNTNFSPEFNNNQDAGGRITLASFTSRTDFPFFSDTYQTGVFSVGDLDGDGLNDFIVNEFRNNQFSVWRNTGVTGGITTASFAPKVTTSYLPLGSKGENILVDLDGDGKLDLVLGNADTFQSHLGIYRNISTPGTIAFAPVQYIASSSYADGPLNAADMDGDGRPEIISTFDNSSGGTTAYFTVYPNLSTPGDIEIAPFIDFDFGVLGQSSTITPGDLNNDGKLDVVVASSFDSQLYVYQNTATPGALSFDTPFPLTGVPNGVRGAALADLDNDGKIDIAWGHASTPTVYVVKNIFSGTTLSAASFATPVTFASTVGNPTNSVISVADINGDNKPDLIIPGQVDIAVLENTSVTGVIDSKSFLPGIPFKGRQPTTGAYSPPVVVDIDGDGKMDIMAGETGLNTVPGNISIWRNECFPRPTITSITPSPVAAGGTLTIMGNLMQTGLVPGALLVRESGLLSTSNTTSAITTTATVPLSAKSDPITITTHGLTSVSSIIPVTFPTTNTIDATSFASAATYALAGSEIYSLITGDWDNDGKVDVGYVENYHTGSIYQNTQALIGQPILTGSLTKTTINLNAYDGMATLDIDGDGKLDISSGYSYYQNASTPGSILFPAAQSASISNGFHAATTADFNNDGKIDIAGITVQLSVSLFQNNSNNGPFTSTSYFSTFPATAALLTRPAPNGSIASADFDGDGNVDIVTANPSTNNFSLFTNLGVPGPLAATSFAAAINTATGTGPYGIVAVDFDNDGKPDIATCHFGSTIVNVYRNTSTPGSISFAAAVPFTCITKGFDMIAQDLDGDSKPEMIVIHQTPGSFSVFQNTSTPGALSFGSAVNKALPNLPVDLASADVNLDNKPDLLFVTQSSDALIVFQNNIPNLLIKIGGQPVNALVCPQSTASFKITATGTTNITYQWQKSAISPIAFSNMIEGNGFTGTTSSTLNIDLSATTNADQFIYRCTVGGDLSGSVNSNSATLTIQSFSTTPPVAINGSGCTGTSVTLNASGSNNGNYKWYTDPTGGTAITDAVNSAYATPELAQTTTFYVSISNGTCETVRVPVIATINSCTNDKPPVIQAATEQTSKGEPITVNLVSLISDPDDNLDLTTLTIVSQPTSGATATIDAAHNLVIDYAATPFSGTDHVVIKVCDISGECTQQTIDIVVADAPEELTVYHGISPGGKNPIWLIQNIEVLPDTQENHVILYNRWGDKVFEVDNYNNKGNAFIGTGTSGSDLPSGTYFYKISFTANTRKSLTGYLSLKR